MVGDVPVVIPEWAIHDTLSCCQPCDNITEVVWWCGRFAVPDDAEMLLLRHGSTFHQVRR